MTSKRKQTKTNNIPDNPAISAIVAGFEADQLDNQKDQQAESLSAAMLKLAKGAKGWPELEAQLGDAEDWIRSAEGVAFLKERGFELTYSKRSKDGRVNLPRAYTYYKSRIKRVFTHVGASTVHGLNSGHDLNKAVQEAAEKAKQKKIQEAVQKGNMHVSLYEKSKELLASLASQASAFNANEDDNSLTAFNAALSETVEHFRKGANDARKAAEARKAESKAAKALPKPKGGGQAEPAPRMGTA